MRPLCLISRLSGQFMANKPVLIVGGICIVLAIASFGIAGSSWSDATDEFENSDDMEAFTIGPDNSFTYTYTDENGLGSSGFLGTLGACCCGLRGILLLVGALTGGAPKPMVGYMPQQGMQQQGMMPQQQMGQMPVQQPQYAVGTDIDSSSVADTPVTVDDSTSSVWD